MLTARLRGGAAACDGGLGGGQNYASTVWSEVVLLQKVQVDLSRVVKVVRGDVRRHLLCPRISVDNASRHAAVDFVLQSQLLRCMMVLVLPTADTLDQLRYCHFVEQPLEDHLRWCVRWRRRRSGTCSRSGPSRRTCSSR